MAGELTGAWQEAELRVCSPQQLQFPVSAMRPVNPSLLRQVHYQGRSREETRVWGFVSSEPSTDIRWLQASRFMSASKGRGLLTSPRAQAISGTGVLGTSNES